MLTFMKNYYGNFEEFLARLILIDKRYLMAFYCSKFYSDFLYLESLDYSTFRNKKILS